MTTDDRPNILILMTDQQSHNLLSCAGTSWVSTPALDRLAAGGVRMTRAYCANPVCIPSRFTMFTGRMPSAIGMRGNGGPNLTPLSPEHDQASLGHVLRRAGYQTLYGGKVHLPVDLTPERIGFEYFCSDERETLAKETADLIREKRNTRWAMVASLINPHDICYQAIRHFAAGDDELRILKNGKTELRNLDEAIEPPPGVDRETFLRDYLPPLPANFDIQPDEPELITTILAMRPFKLKARQQWGETDWRLHRWAYARLMERADRQIGQILDALAESGCEQNTLVIMTSDHGDHAGSHRLEHKTFFYDEAARVPWIMRLPGRIPAGAVREDVMVATGLDLMATCCDYAGAAMPSHCLGVSQRPAAEGRAGPVRTLCYGENAVSRMVVTSRWKYVRYDHGQNAEQLYDLANDPREQRNHAHDPAHRATFENMQLQLQSEMAQHQAVAIRPVPPPPSANAD